MSGLLAACIIHISIYTNPDYPDGSLRGPSATLMEGSAAPLTGPECEQLNASQDYHAHSEKDAKKTRETQHQPEGEIFRFPYKSAKDRVGEWDTDYWNDIYTKQVFARGDLKSNGKSFIFDLR